MGTYYIRFDTYWQNSADRFCGPFDSREAAELEIDRAVRATNSKVVRSGNQPADIRESVRILGIVTKTQAGRGLKRGMEFRRLPMDIGELNETERYMMEY